MIFITGKNLIRGYINKVTEREMPNGGTVKSYKLGTREVKQDGTKVFSSWWFSTMGEARKKEGQLEEGKLVDITSFKMTNVSKKNDDGTWSRPFLDMRVSNFELYSPAGQQEPPEDEEESPFE
jgi:hypothetical protein